MENDQTIFQKPNTLPVENPQQASPSLTFADSSQPVVPSAPSQNSNQPVNPRRKLSMPSSLLKILLGFLFIFIICVIVFFVVLPLFNKNSNRLVTLSYWGLWEDNKTMQPIISDFERENPNIKINYSKQDIKQYRDTLATMINNGTGPDIFTFHNTWYPMLSSVLLPFPSSTISKQDFANSFYLVSQKDLIKNGAIYGVPMGMDTLSMYINTDLFKSAGLTPPGNWNDFINDARGLTVKDEAGKIKTAGAAMGTYDNITHAPDIMSLLFLQNSVDLTNIQTSSDRVQSALSFYTSFSNDQNNVWDNTLDPSILAFSKGNLAMFFGYSWDYFTIKAFNPNLNLQILPVPQLANQNSNLASYWIAGISTKTPYQKEALLFIKYLSQKSTEEKLYEQESKERAFGQPYARPDLADKLKDNPLVYPFIAQAKTAQSSYFVDSTNDNGLNQQLNTYLGNAINAINTGTSVQSAFDTFSQGTAQVLQKYGQ